MTHKESHFIFQIWNTIISFVLYDIHMYNNIHATRHLSDLFQYRIRFHLQSLSMRAKYKCIETESENCRMVESIGK